MLKAQLEVAVEQYRAAARHAISHARDLDTGRCRMCEVERGVQHEKYCHLWPLIDARIEHEMADKIEAEELEFGTNEIQI